MLSSKPEIIEKLDHELIGWLTTVSSDGQPQTSPVWFLVDDDELLVYSQPNTAKLRNIESNPKVAFNLRGDAEGDDVVTMEGRASVELDAPLADQIPRYVDKYDAKISGYGWTAETFARDYSVRIRIRLTRVRG
ncbi:MAG: TIGR03667 family PPOX class F420-dependent oxidoreductase [Acidimicrobiia bacterium]